MAAYLPEEGVILKQVAVATKEYEIKAAPHILWQIDLENKIVCGVDMQIQRLLSVNVLAKGGDHIWHAKAISPLFVRMWHSFSKGNTVMSAGRCPSYPEQLRRRRIKGMGV